MDRSFDRSREQGVKRVRLPDDPNLRDPRLLNSGGGVTRGSVRVQSRYRQIEREDEGDELNGGGYHPTHQLFSELVSEYRKGLAELTINSKPIITNLTIIAGENLHAAKSIAEAICSHIIEVPSEQKLPSLYLLDSIVKNIGRDYIKYFSMKLPEVFCKAYKQADPSIHAGLRHLFRTWEGVFPLQPLHMIEKELGISLAVNGSGSVSARSKPEPQSQYPQKSIHVNPKYLEARQKLQPPARVKGPTNDISSNVMKSTGNASRLSIQHREPARESLYEKDEEVVFDDYNYSVKKSNIGEHDKRWYGTGADVATTVLGQRNGYDGKRKLASYASPQPHVSRTDGGMPRTWKNNDDEDEYLWDDINSSVTKHSAPIDPRKGNVGFDEPDDMETDGAIQASTLQSIQSADYARVLGASSAVSSSSLGRKALQPQMIRNSATGVLARSQMNNTPTIVQKRPLPSRQLPLHQLSPSPSFDLPVSQSMQSTVSKSSEIPGRDNIRPRAQLKRDSLPLFSQTGKKQHLDLQKTKVSTSSILPSQQRMQQHTLPDHSRSDVKLPGSISETMTSETSVAEAVQQLTSSGLFSAILNSGVLSKGDGFPKSEVVVEDMLEPLQSDILPPVRGGLSRRQMPYKESEMSASPMPISSQVHKQVSVPKKAGVVSQSSSSKAVPINEGEEKAVPAYPYSNLFSTLMEKGLITSSKSESSTSSSTENKSETAGPVVISKSSMAKISALEQAAHKTVDDASKAPEVKSLIGFEFKPSLIRQLHKPVVEDITNGVSYRCDICGLRFKYQERVERHMEWHSAKELNNEYGASRRWFPDLDDWVAGNLLAADNPVDSAEETEEASIEDETCLVPADESQCVCILCGELFEDYYSHEYDEWMFRGATHVKSLAPEYESPVTSNIIVHAECLTEISASELGLVANVNVEEVA